MSGSVAAAARAYLDRQAVMTLATAGADGVWAAAVFFASRDFALFFVSSPTSRHGSHLEANPRVAATVQENGYDWQAIRGIQLEGEVRRLCGAEQRAAAEIYYEKFPNVAPARAPEVILRALDRVAWYRLDPHRLWYIDNSRAFGRRDEVELPSGRGAAP